MPVWRQQICCSSDLSKIWRVKQKLDQCPNFFIFIISPIFMMFFPNEISCRMGLTILDFKMKGGLKVPHIFVVAFTASDMWEFQKTKFNGLKINIGPQVNWIQIVFLKIWTWININCMNEQVSNTGSSGPLVVFLMNINNNSLSLIKFVVLKQKPDFSNRVLFWIVQWPSYISHQNKNLSWPYE